MQYFNVITIQCAFPEPYAIDSSILIILACAKQGVRLVTVNGFWQTTHYRFLKWMGLPKAVQVMIIYASLHFQQVPSCIIRLFINVLKSIQDTELNLNL